MSKKDNDIELLFTTELVKSEYVKAVKAVAKAKAQVKNAEIRLRLLMKAMNELGYTMEIENDE